MSDPERCQVPCRRVPTLSGLPQDAYAHIQLCGRPVLRAGLCVYHWQKGEIPADEERQWRKALRMIRRG